MVCLSKLSVTTVVILSLSIVIFSLSYLHQKCIIIHDLTSYKSILLTRKCRAKAYVYLLHSTCVLYYFTYPIGQISTHISLGA